MREIAFALVIMYVLVAIILLVGTIAFPEKFWRGLEPKAKSPAGQEVDIGP